MASFDKKILIVEDNIEDRRIYNHYLIQDTTNTYQILEATTGEEGLKLFADKHPELILLDFNLPDINGLEFIAKLKTSFHSLPPIIMLAKEGNEAIAVKAMKAGVQDYLIKEKINAESLRLVVCSVLKQARLQQLAQRNEHRFRVSVENMLDCFGMYTSIRDENAQIVGFSPDYLNDSATKNNLFHWQEKSESDIFDSSADLFALCCEVVETGKTISTEYSLPSKPHQQASKPKFLEIRINQLEDGFVAVWRDITESIQVKLALEESEAKFRVLITQAPVGIFQTNNQGDCIYVNPHWLKITGLTEIEAMGKGWSNALHPEDKARVYQEWYEATLAKREFTSEYRFKSLDGTITWLSGKAVTMYSDQGECIGYFGTIIDITERKKAEALLQKQQEQLIDINQNLKRATFLLKKRNQELDEFAYIVSHDLKAPLRAIRNLSTWIEEDLADKFDDDTRQNFKLLKNRVNRMQMFIQSLLEYSRVGRVKTPPEMFAVKDLLVDIIDSLAPPATFTIAISGSMPIVKTQKIALQQVFANLISNAIEHHSSLEGKIDISATEDREFYYFAVADDGIGIALEHQERIFGIFKTLSSRDDRENTGIGLSIVKKIVESQGGKIKLESEPDKGTTFRFSWLKNLE